MEFRLIHATDDVRLIIKIANRCLRRMFRSGYYYKKAGVCLEDLIPKDPRQLDMFHQPTNVQVHRTEQLMSLLDKVNHKYGLSTIRLAAEGYSKTWDMRAELKSPAYTIRWSDVPKVSFS